MDQQQQQFNLEAVESLEKRCLVYMKLKQYEKVVQDGKKLLELQYNNPLAFKCLLAALCKINQVSHLE